MFTFKKDEKYTNDICKRTPLITFLLNPDVAPAYV